MNQNLLKENTFTFFISRNDSFQSKFFIGGYPKNYATDSQPTFHPVIEKNWFTLKLTAVKLNGKDTGLCRNKNCAIIIDTGASSIAAPEEDYESFMGMLTNNSDCQDFRTFPNIT